METAADDEQSEVLVSLDGIVSCDVNFFTKVDVGVSWGPLVVFMSSSTHLSHMERKKNLIYMSERFLSDV